MVILILLLASLLGAAASFPFGQPATTVYRYGQPYGPPPPSLITLGSMPFPQLYSAVQDDLQFNANQQQRFYSQQQPPRYAGAGIKQAPQQQFPQQQPRQQQVPAPVKNGPQFQQQQQQQYLALTSRPTELQQPKESLFGPEGKDFLASLQIIDTSGKPRTLQDFGIGGGPSGRAYEPELEEQLLSIFSTIQQDLKGAAYLPLNMGPNQPQSQPPRQLEQLVSNPQQQQLGYSFKQPAQHQFQYLKPVRASISKAANQEPIRSPIQALRVSEGVAKQEQQQQEKNIKSPAQVVRSEPEPIKRPFGVSTPNLAQKELVVPPRVEQKPVVELERKPLAVEAPIQAPEQQQQGFDDDLNDKSLEQVQLKEPIKEQKKELTVKVPKQQTVRPIPVAPVNNQQQQRYNIDTPMNGWVPLLQTFPVDQKTILEPHLVEQIREQLPALEEQKQLKEEKQIVGQQQEEQAKDLQEEQKVDSFGDNQQQLQAPAKSIKRGRARQPSGANIQMNPTRAGNIYQQKQAQQPANFESQQQVRENAFQQQEQFIPEQRQEEQLSTMLEQQKEDMLQQQRDLAEMQKSQKQEELNLQQQQRQELQTPTTTAAPIAPRPVRINDGVKGGRVKLITDKMRPSPIQRMRDQQLKAQRQQLEQSKRPRELTSAPRLPVVVQKSQEELVEQVKEELPRQEEIRQQEPVPAKVPVRQLGEKKRIIPSFQEQQQLQIQKQIQQQQQLQEQQLPDQAPEFNEQSQQQKQEFNEQQDVRQLDLDQQKEELPVRNQDQDAGEQREEVQQQQQQEEQQQKEEQNQQQPQQEVQVERKEEQQPALVQQKDEIDQQQKQQQQREELQQQKEDQQQQQQQQQQEGFSEQPALGQQREEVSQQQQQKEELNQQRDELSQQKEDQQPLKLITEASSQQQEEENVQLKEDQPKQELQQQQQSADKLEEVPSRQRSEATTTSTTTSTSTTTIGSTSTEFGSSQQPIELTSQQEQKQDQPQEEAEKKVEVNQTFGQEQEQQQQQQRGELTTVKSSQLIDEEPAPILTTTQRPPTRIRPSFFKKLDGDRFTKQKIVPSQEKKEEVQTELTVATTLRPKGRIIKGRRQQAQQQQPEGQKRGPARNWTTYSTRPRSNENFQPQERDNNEGILSANQLLNTYNPLQFEPERISSLNNRATESSPQNTNVNSSPMGESY